ncbi:HNH endonuclease [Hymenobacter terrenus]|uniref:HNH endonuclease n=1 Tax=Hymenobacter terrenus TaxID=1629124 RepID=UPI0006981A0C|nr:HNH endonuclease [Hymenobacter terrenus]
MNNTTTDTLAANETYEYMIYTFQDDKFIAWNAREVSNYPNYYITDCGRVFSTNINRFLKPSIKTGYRSVSLSNADGSKRFCIHRLVAQHFVPNPESRPFVDHVDRDKLNNHASNLRWCTPQQNCFNQTKKSNKTSLYMGVSANRSGSYSAAIKLNGKKITIGSFPTQQAASEAYQKAKQEIHVY